MNALRPKIEFIKDEINIEKLSPIYVTGIKKAMDKYAKHYYETMQANEFEKPQEQCTLPDVVQQREQFKAVLFKMANNLAVAQKGDQAVLMHQIHNSL